MTDMNVICLTGRLVREAKLIGKLVTFTVAVNRTQKGQDGKYTEMASFIDCKGFTTGLIAYLTQGRQVSIVGQLVQESWNDQQGVTKSTFRVICNSIQLLNSDKSEGSNNGYKNNNNHQNSVTKKPEVDFTTNEYDDLGSVPF